MYSLRGGRLGLQRPLRRHTGTSGPGTRGKKKAQNPSLPTLQTCYYNGELLLLYLSQKKKKFLGVFICLLTSSLCLLLTNRCSAPTCIHCDSLLVNPAMTTQQVSPHQSSDRSLWTTKAVIKNKNHPETGFVLSASHGMKCHLLAFIYI